MRWYGNSACRAARFAPRRKCSEARPYRPEGIAASATASRARPAQPAPPRVAARNPHRRSPGPRNCPARWRALEFAQEAEGAALRVAAALQPPLLDAEHESFGISDSDAALTAAVTSEATARLNHYRRLHERGFYAALHELLAVQENRRRLPAAQPIAAQFSDEARCMACLVARINSPEWRCPHCGHPRGAWLSARCRWECAACRKQVGPRGGTVMQGSALPLATWFAAIAQVTVNASISAAGLAEAIGLRRLATARCMLRKILAALASADAERLLAGLQRTGMGPRLPESGAVSTTISTKQTSHSIQRARSVEGSARG